MNSIIYGPVPSWRLGKSLGVDLLSMPMKLNKDFAGEIAKVVRFLSPDEVELNTPLRTCAVKPLTSSQIAAIKGSFGNLRNVVTAYSVERKAI